MEKRKRGHLITHIEPNSIASELEIDVGDRLISINDQEIEDIFDYHYLTNDEWLELLVEKQNGEEWILEIEKDYEEDLGLVFENGLMDDYKSCSNKCIFCFIDQMPPGMRETLYFKDDDSRLSFLQGNYITLTNMREKDIERIIKYHLSPINISIHTTNPRLRCKMLNNRFAGEALKNIDKLYDAKIQMNGQIVLCKNINDGDELERTIYDTSRYVPYMESLSVVPVGLTKYREGLCKLEPFTKEDAENVIDLIEKWQGIIYRETGTHFVHASDEFYILANRELPEAKRYDGYIQLENGVGMIRLLLDEVSDYLETLEGDDRELELSLATGELCYGYIRDIVSQICEKFPRINVHVYNIKNNFFGERITVSGLITGKDLTEQLTGQKLGQCLLLPINMFRSAEEVFLDDLTKSDLENILQVKIDIVKSSGQDLVDSILQRATSGEKSSYNAYELNNLNGARITEEVLEYVDGELTETKQISEYVNGELTETKQISEYVDKELTDSKQISEYVDEELTDSKQIPEYVDEELTDSEQVSEYANREKYTSEHIDIEADRKQKCLVSDKKTEIVKCGNNEFGIVEKNFWRKL